ncbi:MAG: A/G-specific adenine glycosylase [Bryobacteraceae bacterium]|nr:A/G-specific adenine glycosylase [Bryobacteraceae bacterium]
MSAPRTAVQEFRRALLDWYRAVRRPLPWRETRDPYRVWLSEIMLQQTRVAAALPYYQRFLERFPTVEALAAAPEEKLLKAWEGLGYYTRARNMQKAAKKIVAAGAFPNTYEGIWDLPGIGAYTAAAIASVVFGLRHAVLDGNVMRVVSRLTNDAGDIRNLATRARLQSEADALLNPQEPADHNQAMMELGATLCLPKSPQCLLCPVSAHCRAFQEGTQNELPIKSRPREKVVRERVLYLVRRNGSVLLWQRPQSERLMPGFWELPEAEHLPSAKPVGKPLAEFKHTITHHEFRFQVRAAKAGGRKHGCEWIAWSKIESLPLSTIARKALRHCVPKLAAKA